MTFEDAQKLLDNMLPRFGEYKRNTDADGELTASEKDVLLNIVIDFENDSGQYDYRSALDNIKAILDSRFRVSPNSKITKENGEIIYSNPPAVPFLVKQVIFFIAVSCIVYEDIEYTQADICKHLNLSHNFFGKLGRTPKQYVDMQIHTQPDRVINYKGQKDKEWGIAVKYLVYQAGIHDYFVDIFGGTGAASTAVNHRNNVQYVYNDKDKLMYNLFEVIADDKLYKRLAREINELKDDLYFGQPYLNPALNQVDFSAEIINYYNSKNGKRKPSETRIMKYTPHKYQFKNGVSYLRKLIDCLKSQEDSYYVIYLQKKYSKQDLLNMLDTDDLNASLNKHWKIVFLCSNLFPCSLITLDYLLDINGEDCCYLHRVDVQYRFYKYYAYFTNKRKNISISNDDEKVLYAVACIFINSLKTNGNEDISSILRMNVCQSEDGDVESSTDYKNFLGDNYYYRYACGEAKDYDSLIEKMHEVIRGTICENKDYMDVINRYKSHGMQNAVSPLFYSDSPYVATTGYEESFLDEEIVNLINALVDSGDKFIFSCRAVYGSEKGAETSSELIDKNDKINYYVWNTFLNHYEKGQEFYVLAIAKEIKGAKSLEDLMQNNLITEVMVTNYEIKSFSDDKYKNVLYTVYEFDKFIEAIMRYSNYGKNGKPYTDAEREKIFKDNNLIW